MLTLKNIDLNNLREISLYLLVSGINKDFKLSEQIELFEKTVKLSDPRNLGFIKEVCNGTFNNLIKIDYCISSLITKDFHKIPENILNIMRIAVFQLIYMDSVPDSAAINESVKLVKKYGHQGTVKLTNAVLRNFLRKRDEIENSINDLAQIRKLSVTYSIPEWIISYWSKNISGSELDNLAESMSKNADIFLRINTLKTSIKDFTDKLDSENISYEKTNLDELIKLNEKISVSDIYGFKEGLFYIQDLGAAMVAKILNPQVNDNIIDFCAFPGGKTSHISSLMDNTGNILVIDSNKNREERFTENINRLGCTNIDVLIQSATDKINDIKLVDRILVDPPCSGLGVIRRKNEIKYRRRPEDIERLAVLQYEILSNASNYLKSGGTIVYSTCTISKAENEDIVEKFLSNNKDFSLNKIDSGNNLNDYLNLLPYKNNTDGFFIASISKK